MPGQATEEEDDPLQIISGQQGLGGDGLTLKLLTNALPNELVSKRCWNTADEMSDNPLKTTIPVGFSFCCLTGNSQVRDTCQDSR